jgi:hypothetical protein
MTRRHDDGTVCPESHDVEPPGYPSRFCVTVGQYTRRLPDDGPRKGGAHKGATRRTARKTTARKGKGK